MELGHIFNIAIAIVVLAGAVRIATNANAVKLVGTIGATFVNSIKAALGE